MQIRKLHFPTNCQLNEHSKEEEDGLIGCSKVDATVEADEEDELDQEGGVDNGVGKARSKPGVVRVEWPCLMRAQEVWVGARV